MARITAALVLACAVVALPSARQSSTANSMPSALAARIAHTDPAQYRPSPRVHEGAGQLDYMALFNAGAFDTNHYFLHRGIIEPKSGIGVHFHNQCEEMFVIFNGEAQFTIDGRTATLKGPAGAPTRMGHSHAIYNPTDQPVEWMNINITQIKGIYDAFNLGDSREGAPVDAIPNFMNMRLDRALLQPMNPEAMAKGTGQYRRALGPSVFLTTWSYVDHVLLEPGAETKRAGVPDMGETYYVMNGSGTVTIGTETAPFAKGDALPVRIGEEKSFANTGAEPLEMLVIGVARDMDAKNAFTARPTSARGVNAAARGFGGGGRGAGRGGAGRGAGRGN